MAQNSLDAKLDVQDSHVTLVEHVDGLDKVIIDNSLCYCELHLQGAHVTCFKIKSVDQQLLWLSGQAQYSRGKAIRGGIPICWPWFGAAPKALEASGPLPAHGFARTRTWQLIKAEPLANGGSHVQLSLASNEQTQALWPFEFELIYDVYAADTLKVELTTINKDEQPFELSEALHSYFAVEDIFETEIQGLASTHYVDKVASAIEGKDIYGKTEDSVTIEQEVDRVYLSTDSACTIIDGVSSKSILVEKSGSLDTVVWNPWQDKASNMADFDDKGYQHMLCIEAANTGYNPVTVLPNEKHVISQTVRLK